MKIFNRSKQKKTIFPEWDSRLLEVVLALISALEFREPFTAGHSQQVTLYSLKIGKKLGLTSDEIHNLRYAGLLHDIGKIGVNENIINKPGKLTKKEYEEVKKHPVIAKTILNPIAGLKNIIPLIYYHHERWDGNGYPSGIKGKKIPLGSRIIAVADTLDNLISNRVYRKKMSQKKAIQILLNERNKQLDGKIVDCFIKILKV